MGDKEHEEIIREAEKSLENTTGRDEGWDLLQSTNQFFPEEAATWEARAAAESCGWYLRRRVSQARMKKKPITADDIKAHCTRYRQDYLEYAVRSNSDFTPTHVLYSLKRWLLHFEHDENFGELYQDTLATHDLLSTAINPAPPQEQPPPLAPGK